MCIENDGRINCHFFCSSTSQRQRHTFRFNVNVNVYTDIPMCVHSRKSDEENVKKAFHTTDRKE